MADDNVKKVEEVKEPQKQEQKTEDKTQPKTPVKIDEQYINNKIIEISNNLPDMIKNAFVRIKNTNANNKEINKSDKINKRSLESILQYFNVLSISKFDSSDISICILISILFILLFIMFMDLYYSVNVYFIIGFTMYIILAVIRRYVWKKL